MDYKNAKILLDENEEILRLKKEANEKEKYAQYEVSIHHRTEQLMNLVQRLAKTFPNGRWNDHKLKTIIISYSASTIDREQVIRIKSLETKKKRAFLWFTEEVPAWTRRIGWTESKIKYYSESTFTIGYYSSKKYLSTQEAEKLLALVESEVFDYLQTVIAKPTIPEISYCFQCGFSTKREPADKFCSNCGSKFI